ncbi:hypothetical protein BDP55DRAFT_625965 [Colletotrichum godetiae]|uniref:Uncharacterized protein n=1 Tax=Colletotrichum godetiae TaxID=1209918 RepID=A0AAJ0EZR0_9PEZI|nr:uncharacterized protein BDP55DRAFT_625965 [Colletotrichum godetiae]KAK1700378.1 hypothetical protein BDP55DRAFT_625965 [Colletotrichum godetiae]
MVSQGCLSCSMCLLSVTRQRITTTDMKQNPHRHHKAKLVLASSISTLRLQRSTTRKVSSGGGTFIATASLDVRLPTRFNHPLSPQAKQKTKDMDSEPGYGSPSSRFACFGIERQFLERHKRCFPLLTVAVDPSMTEG